MDTEPRLRNIFITLKHTSFYNQVLFRGQKLCLMTSHLESLKPCAGERMRQLQLLLKKMAEMPDDVNVLFGGDTNLRDAEVRVREGKTLQFNIWY